ncbi:MAG: UDP-N-acetylmuramate dehydrogenase [Flavobacteriales bacterium]|nr:UDP-N-acetylmuramate dehydrogenase [Flavobacteriales bacterium]
MLIEQNISLKAYNTFGIDVKTKLFARFSSVEELAELHSDERFQETRFILGGGSNVLLTQDFDGLVLKNEIIGKEILQEDDSHLIIKVGAGETWHDFVMYCVENNYAGVENMSLIPGSVGAAPMQNIGAYGVELKSVFVSLDAFHIESGEMHVYNNEACKFGYRESIFKNSHKGLYIITSVAFQLNKKPVFNTSYGAISQELKRMGVTDLSVKSISDAVINIRRSKLPDPKEIGNSGSFFKNPVISNELFEKVKQNHPQVASYPNGNMHTKIAAGWLIEQAGWKGKTIGNYGVHKNQALVLVNYGGATGSQIYDLSQEIIDSVNAKFGIELQREVNII